MMKQATIRAGKIICDPDKSPTLMKTLERILDTAIYFTQSQAACLAFLDASNGLFCKVFTKGLSDHFLSNMVFREGGLADEAFRRDRPVLSHDRPDAKYKISQLVRDEGLKSFVCLPLMNEHHRLGVLYVYQGHQRQLQDMEMRLLNTYAFLATSAICAEKEIRDRRMAEQHAATASQAKSEFLASMSHEIRTPMNGVLGMLSLLKQSQLTQEQTEFVRIAYCSAESLLTLLNDILDISKIEAGKLQLEAVDFQLRHTVEEVIEVMSTRAYEKKTELSCFIASTLPAWVNGDPTRLKQILINLVGNAIKFTPDGQIIVRVSRLPDDQTAIGLKFEVIDTGIGISTEAQQRIFQPFEQAAQSTTRTFGGTGLGLAICQHLTLTMQGRIGVVSNLGEGSTFHFTAQFKPPVDPHPDDAPTLDLQAYRALLVDDNPNRRQVLEEILTAWHMGFDCVDRGCRAIERLSAEQQHYDLVVIEQHLPDMNGLEIAAAIHQQLNTPIKMILLTSFGQRGDGDLAKQAGVSAYLTKPIRYAQLRDCILSVLQQPEALSEQILVTKHNKNDRRLKRARILLVEDDAFNQKVALTMLHNLGFRADLAENGEDAIQAVEQNTYDLILMDCQMPRMDGFATTTHIRAMPTPEERDEIPIIALTAHALPGDRQRCTAVGMNDYLAKPIVLEALKDTLTRWLPQTSRTPICDTIDQDPSGLILPFLHQLHQKVGKSFHRVVEIYLDDQEDMISVVEKRIILKQAKQIVRQQVNPLDSEEKTFVSLFENVAKMETGIRYWCEQQAGFLDDLVTVCTEEKTPKRAPQIIDAQTQLVLQEDLEEGYHAALQLFLRDAPLRMAEMSAALSQKNFDLAQRAAHSLKGGCRYLGAEQMAQHCQLLEENAQLEELTQCTQQLEKIHALYLPVKAILSSTISNA